MKREPTDEDKLDHEYGEALIKWSEQYDAYTRLAAPDALHLALAPFEEALGITGELPEKAGIDLLRGWAFDIASRHQQECPHAIGQSAQDQPQTRQQSPPGGQRQNRTRVEVGAPVHRCDPLLGLIVLALHANPAASEADLPPSLPDGIAEFETDPRVFQRVQFYVDQKTYPRFIFRIHARPEASIHELREAIIESWEPRNRTAGGRTDGIAGGNGGAWQYAKDLKPWKVGKGNAIFWTKSRQLGEQRWELIDYSEIQQLL